MVHSSVWVLGYFYQQDCCYQADPTGITWWWIRKLWIRSSEPHLRLQGLKSWRPLAGLIFLKPHRTPRNAVQLNHRGYRSSVMFYSSITPLSVPLNTNYKYMQMHKQKAFFFPPPETVGSSRNCQLLQLFILSWERRSKHFIKMCYLHLVLSVVWFLTGISSGWVLGSHDFLLRADRAGAGEWGVTELMKGVEEEIKHDLMSLTSCFKV